MPAMAQRMSFGVLSDVKSVLPTPNASNAKAVIIKRTALACPARPTQAVSAERILSSVTTGIVLQVPGATITARALTA